MLICFSILNSCAKLTIPMNEALPTKAKNWSYFLKQSKSLPYLFWYWLYHLSPYTLNLFIQSIHSVAVLKMMRRENKLYWLEKQRVFLYGNGKKMTWFGSLIMMKGLCSVSRVQYGLKTENLHKKWPSMLIERIVYDASTITSRNHNASPKNSCLFRRWCRR